ncbi:aminobutyraldehyde dehydrogenase [Lentzea xinjiangensis]|uniref:Aminobutyraldehyde dehydrogenase n=1 Tax=Lentzea xinjiangensis TaxID=402600 RepID=A0A1H9W2V8_9PSEU|nr:aldehyde dehydrogenase family protein [Lentzea xinjiangensis]SES27823.1 aminobutyraldehyde dehydrogenase [Lentzea xinjiangensis]
MRRANPQYGLATTVFTGDPVQARRVGRRIQAGGRWIDTWGLLSEQFEQVGVKGSGYGHLCGLEAVEEFQFLKVYAEMDYAVAHG